MNCLEHSICISLHALHKQFYFGPASFGVIFSSKEIPLERAWHQLDLIIFSSCFVEVKAIIYLKSCFFFFLSHSLIVVFGLTQTVFKSPWEKSYLFSFFAKLILDFHYLYVCTYKKTSFQHIFVNFLLNLFAQESISFSKSQYWKYDRL